MANSMFVIPPDHNTKAGIQSGPHGIELVALVPSLRGGDVFVSMKGGLSHG